MSLTDKILIKLAKAGSEEAFESLVRKYHPSVAKFAYGIIGNADSAADISQQVFLKFYYSLAEFKITDAKITTWLFTITKNLCLNEIKLNKRFAPLKEDIAKENFEDKIASRLDLHDALASLDFEHRQTFLLVKQLGLSYEETAQILDIPLGTVRSRIFNSRKILVKELGASYKKEMV